jgi:hypothetical protein
MTRTQMGLADLLKAWRILGICERESASRAAEVLGFVLKEVIPASMEETPSSTSKSRLDEVVPPESIDPVESEESEISEQAGAGRDDLEVVESRAPSVKRAEWWPQTQPVVHVVRPASPRHGLLSKARGHELTDVLTRGFASTGPIDTDAVIATLAACKPLGKLPRLAVSTFTQLQVVIDRRTSMTPFRSDIAELVSSLRALLGDHLDVISFGRTPLETGPIYSPRPYPLPVGRTSVLFVSSLDIFGETTPWVGLHRRFVDLDVSVAVLCPYAVERVSLATRSLMPVLYWAPQLSTTRVTALLDARRRYAG